MFTSAKSNSFKVICSTFASIEICVSGTFESCGFFVRLE